MVAGFQVWLWSVLAYGFALTTGVKWAGKVVQMVPPFTQPQRSQRTSNEKNNVIATLQTNMNPV